jgi:Xaa-Pro aminopeptidase
MDRENLDAVVALQNNGNWDQGSGNSRYLSSIGGNCAWVSVVFPRRGEVTAVTGPVPTPDYWREFQGWVSDIRPSFFAAVPVVVERLRELGLEHGRIGLAGLAGVARAPDGLVSYGAYRDLRAQLPDAELLNATDLMYEARFVKSTEEIAMLARAANLVQGAMEVLVREARAGVAETVVYARMVGWLLEQGSEPTTLLLWTAGNPVPPYVGTLPSRRLLAADDIICVEADAKWCGYLAHSARTVWVGDQDATDRAMAALQYEATRRCCEALRPGTALESTVGICAQVASDTSFECKPIIHSRGTGLDAPVLVGHARDERTRQWIVEENSVFVVKPEVTTRDGMRKVVSGDTVVVTPTGAKRLGDGPTPFA